MAIDFEDSSVRLVTGEIVRGDVVVGADGQLCPHIKLLSLDIYPKLVKDVLTNTAEVSGQSREIRF